MCIYCIHCKTLKVWGHLLYFLIFKATVGGNVMHNLYANSAVNTRKLCVCVCVHVCLADLSSYRYIRP